MITSRPRHALIVVLAGAVLASTACTNPTTRNAGQASASTPTPAPSASRRDVFGEMNACQVLDDLLAGQGFEPGENKTRRNECGTLKPDYGGYAIALDPVQGLAEFVVTDPGAVSTKINGRNAMQAPTGIYGGCAIAIEVSAHARALVVATMSYSENQPMACPAARELAVKLEPLLPKG